MENVLQIKNLQVDFVGENKRVHALRGIDFEIGKGETLGLVGESGCGKSLTALSIMGLIPTPPGEIVSGEILFKEQNILQYSDKEMQGLRGNRISMIFQEPMTSLNPVFTIGNQLKEVITKHLRKNGQEADDLAAEMLATVGIADAKRRLKNYPHELSGGLRQRVMIAMALLCRPELLIADEPTTALDVTIQAQIMSLLVKLKEDFNTSILMITHDLGIIAETCSRVIVMYMGKIVEVAPVGDLFDSPRHPYTKGLLKSIPVLGQKNRLSTIAGMVPDLSELKGGCAFASRCPYKTDRCLEQEPLLRGENGHFVSCWEA
ncbi:MAG: ABC transporter ATP-binding protein [Erysipelotrichaceae bacterium]|nr:ABC transporter ATP-binding protein [Erysipelotrichaceae bacterium]